METLIRWHIQQNKESSKYIYVIFTEELNVLKWTWDKQINKNLQQF